MYRPSILGDLNITVAGNNSLGTTYVSSILTVQSYVSFTVSTSPSSVLAIDNTGSIKNINTLVGIICGLLFVY